MRRFFAAILPCLAAAALAWPASAWAAAPPPRQQQPEVSLRLVSQSAWNSADHPLELTFQATNQTSEPLTALSVELWILAPAASRSLYELTLTSDATPPLVAYPFPQSGTLQPGQTRTFTVGQTLELLQARNETALYPLKVELRSQDLPVATLRSPMVFLVEPPKVPLNLAWTWVLSEPMQYRPDGVFVAGPIEADIAPGGRLSSTVDALLRTTSRQVDVVVSSVLVDELQRMEGGYRILDPSGTIRTVPAGQSGSADARTLLHELKEVAASERTELLATPFGDPTLPALFRAGLATELKPLTDRGDAIVAQALGREPSHEVARSYRSQLDPASLARLAAMGVQTLLLDPNFVASAKFAAPPVIRLTDGESTITGILPNPEIAALIRTYQADPQLAAHVALGELAAIWLELPGTPGRGTSILFGETSTIPPAFFSRFAQLVRASAWLSPITATGFASVVPATQPRAVPPRNYPSFLFSYVAELLHTRSSLGRYRQTIEDVTAADGPLRDDLELAASGTFVGTPELGLLFVRAVEDAIRRTYDRVSIDASLGVTLTSHGGLIPLVLSNTSGQNLKVVLRFVTDRRLQFVGGNTRGVTLSPGRHVLTVQVRAETTGRIPIKVEVLSSGSAPDTITSQTLVVRSTAYNRVALLITVGAALFLIAWWARRFLPRRAR